MMIAVVGIPPMIPPPEPGDVPRMAMRQPGTGSTLRAALAQLKLGMTELQFAALLEFERQFLAARLHDAAGRHHVHAVGHDVIEQALVMGDDEKPARRRTQGVDAFEIGRAHV